MDLIADIGATNTRVAVLDTQGQIAATARYLNRDHAGLLQVLQEFLRTHTTNTAPARTALAIAAPVAGDEVTMTNIGWQFSQRTLQGALATGQLTVLNDFEALAYALPLLQPDDCLPIGGGSAMAGAAKAVIGPGSGLGVASLVRHQDAWVAISGEGGHVSLPALTADDRAIISDHADATGHCSAEQLLSGPGLVRIYSSLIKLDGQEQQPLTPEQVSERALAGDAVALRTFETFFALLGTVAGNLALTVGARGGVYIAGGIVPRVANLFARSKFRERFIAKGRYRAYLDSIPTALICIDTPAFLGLKARLGYN